jgi:hypothetical protein
MEYHATLHSAAEALRCSDYHVSVMRHEDKEYNGARVVEVDDRMYRILRAKTRLGPGEPMKEGKLDQSACEAIRHALPNDMWSRRAIRGGTPNPPRGRRYGDEAKDQSNEEDTEGDQETHGLRQKAEQAGRRAMEVIDEEAEVGVTVPLLMMIMCHIIL